MPEARLTRGVGEQRGVEQRYERLGERARAAVGLPPDDGVEHRAGSTGTAVGRRDQLTEAAEQLPGDGQPHLDPLVFAHVGQRPFDLAAQVPGDPVGCLGRP